MLSKHAQHVWICAVEHLLSLGANARSTWTPRTPPNANSWRDGEHWPWLPRDDNYRLGILTDYLTSFTRKLGGTLNALHIAVGACAQQPASSCSSRWHTSNSSMHRVC